jgi:hypothetical protein
MYTSNLTSLSGLFTITLLCLTAQAAPLDSNLVKRADLCASEGRVYYPKGKCSSGFVGCAPANSAQVCDGERQYFNDCGHPAYNLGNWYQCTSNGFVGCHTLDACNLGGTQDSTPAPPAPAPPAPAPAPPAPAPAPPAPSKWSCPPGTSYFAPGTCSSGFVGCHWHADEVCPGEKRFYPGDCPAGTGFFQSCSNGFTGCSTSYNMCG